MGEPKHIMYGNPMLNHITSTEEEIAMIIYKITCKITNKIYIGQTSETLKQRFNRHMGYQKEEHDTKFYRAVRKYGRHNFEIEQIDSATTQDELDAKEIYWINYYDSVNKGYNTKESKGKTGGDTLSNHPDRDTILKKIRDSKLGDKNPMRKSGGLKGAKNGMFGKTGKDVPSSRKCVAIDITTGNAKLFDSMTDLQRSLNITTLGSVAKRCKGKIQSPFNGFYFKYYEDYVGSLSTIENISQEKNL